MASNLQSQIAALPAEIIDIIMSRLPYHVIYNLHLAGDTSATRILLLEGQKIISLLERWINPDTKYIFTSARSASVVFNVDFTNLEAIIRHIWNLLICVEISSPDTIDRPAHLDLFQNAYDFITMEGAVPESYDAMCDDIWDVIISEYLESHESLQGGYLSRKCIYRAIEAYPHTHGLDTLAKQKYALAILIKVYLAHKNDIINRYETKAEYYEELVYLIQTISGNGALGVQMVSKEFVAETFYFMKE